MEKICLSRIWATHGHCLLQIYTSKNGKFVSYSLLLLQLHHTLQTLWEALSMCLPVRITMISDVSISEHDGLVSFTVGYLCQAVGIEFKLDVPRSQATESYKHIQLVVKQKGKNLET